MQNTLSQRPDLEDQTLVLRVHGGDHAAFSELVLRHRRSCLQLATSILKEHEEAEDEVQNALWNAFTHIHQFRFESKFSAWLLKIVLNRCRMRLRQLRHFKLLHLDEPSINPQSPVFEIPAANQSPFQALQAKQFAADLQQEVVRMPVRLREVFLLWHVHELTALQVAERLGISNGAVKSRLFRARIALGGRLNKRWTNTPAPGFDHISPLD